MDQDKNQVQGTEETNPVAPETGTKEDAGTKTKEMKKKFRIRFRLPWCKEEIPQKSEEELNAEKAEKEAKKQRRKERIGDFAKGASTVVAVAGLGLAAYGSRKKKLDEEATVDVSNGNDDSEENRTVYLPENGGEEEETEETKKKKSEEEQTE